MEQEVAKNQAALDKATAIRQTELAECNTEHMLQAISALKSAVTVLSKHNSFLQLPSSVESKENKLQAKETAVNSLAEITRHEMLDQPAADDICTREFQPVSRACDSSASLKAVDNCGPESTSPFIQNESRFKDVEMQINSLRDSIGKLQSDIDEKLQKMSDGAASEIRNCMNALVSQILRPPPPT